MGFTALLVQTIAGDVIDKTTIDRRRFLSVAAVVTAFSASAILFVSEGNGDKVMVYTTKIIEGVASSFIAPCVAALTLASFGPDNFDEVMASNILWGHIGSVVSAVLAGAAGYVLYPDIKYCFLVIGISALMAVGGFPFLPESDPLLGRGLERVGTLDDEVANAGDVSNDTNKGEANATPYQSMETEQAAAPTGDAQEVASYWSVFADRKVVVLCLTGFFFQ